MDACLSDDISQVEQCLNEGISIDGLPESNEQTPLMRCAGSGRHRLVEFLIQRRANVNATTSGGWSALLVAISRGHTDVALRLIESKTDVHQQTLQNQNALSLVCWKCAGRCNAKVSKLDVQLATLLLKQNVNSLVKDNENNTALLLCASGRPSSTIFRAQKDFVDSAPVEIPKMLIDEGAIADVMNRFGWTPFMHASFNGNLALMQLLQKHNAVLLARNHQGRSALTYASVSGNPEALRWLLNNLFSRKQLNIDERDNEGQTPLMLSVQCGEWESAKLLIHFGADVTLKDHYGRTAFKHATGQSDNGFRFWLYHEGIEGNEKRLQTDQPQHENNEWLRDSAIYANDSDCLRQLWLKV